MRELIELRAASALVVFSDAELELRPPDLGSPGFKRYFVELARDGKVFFLDGEDPRHFRLLIADDDDLADLPSYRYARLSGFFRLALPTGRLVVSDGGNRISGRPYVPSAGPGDYSATVHGVDAQHFDAVAYRADERKAVGEADWRYRAVVSALRIAGVLVLFASCAVIMVNRWSVVSVVAAAVGLLALVPPYLMSRTARYRASDERLAEFERRHAQFAVTLRRVGSAEGLMGGYHTV